MCNCNEEHKENCTCNHEENHEEGICKCGHIADRTAEYDDSLPCGPGPCCNCDYDSTPIDFEGEEAMISEDVEEEDIDDELGIKEAINEVIASKEVEGETVSLTQDDIDKINKELSEIIDDVNTKLSNSISEVLGEESQEEIEVIDTIKDILLGNTGVTKVVFSCHTDTYESYPQSIKDIHNEVINSCDKVFNLLSDATYLFPHRGDLMEILDMNYFNEHFNPNEFNYNVIYDAYIKNSLQIKEDLGKDYFVDLVFHRGMLDTNINKFMISVFDSMANCGEISMAYKLDESNRATEASRLRLRFDVDSHTYFNELVNYTNIEYEENSKVVADCDEEIKLSYSSHNVINLLTFQMISMFIIDGYVETIMAISTPVKEETYEEYMNRLHETRKESLTDDTMKKIFEYVNRLINE